MLADIYSAAIFALVPTNAIFLSMSMFDVEVVSACYEYLKMKTAGKYSYGYCYFETVFIFKALEAIKIVRSKLTNDNIDGVVMPTEIKKWIGH